MDEFDALVASVTAQLREQLRGARQGALDEARAFFHAVSWRNEPWLWGVLAFHVALAGAAWATRRSEGAQAALFGAALAAVYASERLNAAAHARWRSFATQDYFDARGVFVGLLWAGPLLLTLCAMLVGFVVRAARLLVKVKRAQLRTRAKRDRGEQGADAAAAGAGAVAAGAVAAPRRRAARRAA